MSYNSENFLQSTLLFDKYKIITQIGKGSFGTVFSGINTLTNEKVAIKCEKAPPSITSINPKHSTNCPFPSEASTLSSLNGIKGIPHLYDHGIIKGYNILILELLGTNLHDLFRQQHKNFSLQTVCLIALEMIKIIKSIHQKNLLHRDIKPENFVVGIDDKKDALYLIDFGLAKSYITSKGTHIPIRNGKAFTGTARYCSIYTHQGFEQSRRDDLESIGYVLMYFLRGSLPWEDIEEKEGDKYYEQIGKVKMNTSIQELCAGYPEEMKYYFNYVKRLRFEEEPNYSFLSELFEGMLRKVGSEGEYQREREKERIMKGKEVNWKMGRSKPKVYASISKSSTKVNLNKKTMTKEGKSFEIGVNEENVVIYDDSNCKDNNSDNYMNKNISADNEKRKKNLKEVRRKVIKEEIHCQCGIF